VSVQARALLPLVALALVQIGIVAFVRAVGPLAISDDDYARVVIAQNLALEPKLDPSGTSWLPFPFYVTGAAMALFGTTLEVARATQVVLALVSAGLLYFGSRRLGLSPWLAALAAAIAAALPSAARLSAATVPEYPTAACMAFAMLCLVRPANVESDGRGAPWLLLGAGSLFLASASRYDAWPVAGVFAGVTACRALFTTGHERRTLLLSCALAAAFPLLWLLHGIVWHDDALFFVARVARYKAALGGAAPSLAAAWLGYPLAAVRTEPGAAALLLAAVLHLTTTRGRPALRSLAPLFGALAALLFVLVLGDVRGGAPTHHPERALLSLWLVTPAIALYLLAKQATTVRQRVQAAILFAAPLLLTFGARSQSGAFANRAEEERLGRALRDTSGSVVIHTPDYGYFAVQAASSRPDRFVIVDRNDPRDARQAISDEDRARLLLAETRAPWAVLPLGIVVPGYRMVEHGERLEVLGAGESNVGYALLEDER